MKFLTDLASNTDFQLGKVHTDFIPEHQEELFPKRDLPDYVVCQAALALVLLQQEQSRKTSLLSLDPFSPFSYGCGSRLNHHLTNTVQLDAEGSKIEVKVTYLGLKNFTVNFDGKEYNVTGQFQQHGDAGDVTCSVNGITTKNTVVLQDETVHLFTKCGSYEFILPAPKFVKESGGGTTLGGAVAPMPGVIENILVKPGDSVDIGDPLLVMIAMKMEYVIRAHKACVVDRVLFKEGDSVMKNAELIKFVEHDSDKQPDADDTS